MYMHAMQMSFFLPVPEYANPIFHDVSFFSYFICGGSVNGGQILGQFPSDMSSSSPIGLGRGRLVPTTSWDQIWNGIAQHHGVTTEEELNYVCPNRAEFTDLFTDAELFKSTAPARKKKYLRR